MPVNDIREFIVETSGNLRVIQAGATKISLERRDPFGFWYVKMEKGSVPQVLDQAFAGIDRAYEAVTNYVNGHEVRLEQMERDRIRNAKAKFEEKHSE